MDMLTSYSEFVAEIWRKDQEIRFFIWHFAIQSI